MKKQFKMFAAAALGVAMTVGVAEAAEYQINNVTDLDNRLKNAASGDVLILAPGDYDVSSLTPTSPKEMGWSTGDTRKAYLLTKMDVTINGANTKHWSEKSDSEVTRIICSGDPQARLLYCFSGSARGSHFQHLTFEGGDATAQAAAECGGAIYFLGPGNGTATNCVFKNCKGYDGGATHSVPAVDCKYDSCVATRYGGGAKGDGAANYNSATNVFRACRFENCTAGGGRRRYLLQRVPGDDRFPCRRHFRLPVQQLYCGRCR